MILLGTYITLKNASVLAGLHLNYLLVAKTEAFFNVIYVPRRIMSVCALKWSYNEPELASGGNDNRVCNLIWSKNVNELVSTHGYCQNHILVWRYSTMSKLATLKGHEARVLYPAISPDGKTIVTGARDETLRFWNVFPSPRSQVTIE
ncbi:hypothetical protein POM88_017621 [Heracleum sosnowskyi]|uniref:Uncharacterized protein n=1 Tax=Heracleum sosnowskyi TaxID=360622 RepID=A0AAD8IR29_9APIA|nr:hypothetical protein POM88_017621 [Heracleum sosnowskyi]